MKYIFIVNAIAGKGKYKKILPRIEKVCKEEKREYEVRYITEELSGADIASEYKNEENVAKPEFKSKKDGQNFVELNRKEDVSIYKHVINNIVTCKKHR